MGLVARDQLDEQPVRGARVDEHLSARTIRADQLHALFLERLDRARQVLDAHRQRVHPLAPALDRASDGRLGSERRDEFEKPP